MFPTWFVFLFLVLLIAIPMIGAYTGRVVRGRPISGAIGGIIGSILGLVLWRLAAERLFPSGPELPIWGGGSGGELLDPYKPWDVIAVVLLANILMATLCALATGYLMRQRSKSNSTRKP
jgi:hypothetical protein